MQRITLRLRDDTLQFHAGQYLEILHPDGAAVPLSIASSPLRLPELEFHYQSTTGSADASRLDELLQLDQPLQLGGPLGKVFITATEPGPLLLVAGGTGASQALAIIEDLSLRNSTVSVTLLCCAERAENFYFRESLEQLQMVSLKVEYIADPSRNKSNLAMVWLRKHASEHSTGRVILCGGPPFVYAAADALLAGGVSAQQTESDVYAYAPKD